MDLSQLGESTREGPLIVGNPIESRRALAVIFCDGGGQNDRLYGLHRIHRAVASY